MKTRTKVTIAASVAVLLAGVSIASISQAHGLKGSYQGGSSYGMGYGGHGMGGGRHMDGQMGRFGGEYGGRHGARYGGQGMMSMFDSFDGNGDGSLTQAEIDQARAARLAGFDTDGDGSLSLKEYEALWSDAMRERMVDRFQNLDADGDGTVTKAEFTEPFAGKVQFMDRNGDGVLSRDDMGRRGRMMKEGDND